MSPLFLLDTQAVSCPQSSSSLHPWCLYQSVCFSAAVSGSLRAHRKLLFTLLLVFCFSACLWPLRPPWLQHWDFCPVHYAVSAGEQLDEVWTSWSGLSGLVHSSLGSALHWQTGHGESAWWKAVAYNHTAVIQIIIITYNVTIVRYDRLKIIKY